MGQALEDVRALIATARENPTAGAFVLRAPGTYVRAAPDRFVIGNRPGTFHRVVAGGSLAVGLAAGYLFWTVEPILGGFIAFFFALPLLTLLNTQRYEVFRGVLRARGKALGQEQQRDWPLPADSTVRILGYPYFDADGPTPWTAHQVQLRADGFWVPLAESLNREEVVPVARQVAAAAGVPLRD